MTSEPVPAPPEAAGPAVPPARIRGIPMPLPVGEQVRWQGTPNARALARHTFHQRKLAAYFYLMLAWWMFNSFGELPRETFLLRGSILLVLSSLPVLFAEVLARLVARTSVYAITDRRVVLKVGIVFPMTINIPLRLVAGAGIRRYPDGTGHIAFPLVPGERLAYVALWPHCRVFDLTRPIPVLRGLTDPVAVGQAFREVALAQDGGAEAPPSRAADVPSRSEPVVA
jgi:hypothetical protein